MADRTARLRVVVDSDTKGADRAALSLEKIDDEAARAGKSLATMGDDANGASGSFKKLGDTTKATTRDVRTHADAVKILREEYKQTQTRIRELNVDLLRRGGSDSGILKRLRAERSELRSLTRIGAELGITMGGAAAEGFGSTFKSLISTGGAGGAAIGGAIGGLVTAAAPGLGALIGGALTGALGTGAMALGILSAAKNSEVKSAAREFGDSVMGEFFAGGTAFVEPIKASLNILRQGFRDLDLADLLAPLAPTVITIAHGIADFVKNLKDNGLAATFKRMDQYAHIAAEGLAAAGDALGFFFDEISKDKGSMDGLRALFAILNGTIRVTAVGINILEAIFHTFSVTAAGVLTLLDKITPGHFLDPFIKGAEAVVGYGPQISSVGQNMATAIDAVNNGLDPFAAYLKEASSNARDLKFSLDELFGKKLAVAEATVAWKQELFDLNEELKKNGFSVKDNTEAGLRHQQMVLDAIQKAKAIAQATYEETHSKEAAKVAYDNATAALRDFLTKAGLTKEAIDKLIGEYTFTITGNLVWHERNRPSFNLGNLTGPAADLFRADGGPVMAGQPYVVGEKRPELFVPTQNGVIIPEVPRAGANTSTGYASSQNARPVVVSGGGFTEAAFEWLREQIAAKGGTLAVLGLRN